MSRFGDLIRGTAPAPEPVEVTQSPIVDEDTTGYEKVIEEEVAEREAPAPAAPAAPEPVAAPTPPVEAVKPVDPAPLKSAAPKRSLRAKK